jgi:hypothetical protein
VNKVGRIVFFIIQPSGFRLVSFSDTWSLTSSGLGVPSRPHIIAALDTSFPKLKWLQLLAPPSRRLVAGAALFSISLSRPMLWISFH